MCLSCAGSADSGSSVSFGLSRRSMLLGAGGMAASAGLSACSTGGRVPAAPASSATASGAGARGERSALELVLLGTQAGPPIEQDRAGISSALVVDGTTYIVDCGRSAASQFARAGLSLRSMNSIFLTHLHADHVSDYYSFFLGGGHIPNTSGDTLPGPVTVYGPGSAGALPPTFGGGTAPTVNADEPAPGTAAMTRKLHAAYAYSTNVFLRDMHIRDIRQLTDVREIEPPDVGASATNTAPSMEPFTVMRDERVHVTATLVPHGPAFPSFAFRFDTRYGSVTFSGDTARSDNLIRLARGTDLLVHEAIGIHGESVSQAALDHMLQSHVRVEEVGAVAQQARVNKLVLSHIAEVGTAELDVGQWSEWAQQGYDGPVVVGEDLQRFVLA